MKTRTKFLTLLTVLILCLATAFGVAACGDGGGGGTTGLTINKTTLSIPVNSTDTLSVIVTDNTVTPEWSIEDPTIAELTVLGKVCAVKALKEGTTTITVKYGAYTVTCSLTVTPDNTEKVSITLGDEAVTEAEVEMGKTITLVGTASQGSALTWKSSKESVATVENGVVTGHLAGTAVITAQVTPSIKASVTVTVKPPEGSDYYNLKFAAEWGTKVDVVDYSEAAKADEYFYWGGKYAEFGQSYQEVTVEEAYYHNKQVHVKYTCDTDDGKYEGFQMFYKNSEHTLGHYYKLTAKINIDSACKVTLNGNVIDLTEGDNTVTVYYQYTSGLGEGEQYGISSFDLVMGYADGSQKGVFVQNATFTVSEVAWVDDTETRVKLEAPSFTYNAETGVVNITDGNTAGVGGYRLDLYQDGALKATVDAENGKAIDLSAVENGEYTAKIVAVAANAHYINSDASTDESTITVENAGGATYDLANNNLSSCVDNPGKWTYWSEDWVNWTTKQYKGGVVTLEFSNNAGNWYDTQVFYKNPGDENGKTYKMVVTIDSSKGGKVTINGGEVTLEQGAHDYTVIYTAESNKSSFQIVFGLDGKNNQQEIQDGIVKISLKSVEEAQAVQLKVPSFTVGEENVITITDSENEAGTAKYELGFFEGDETVPTAIVTVVNGEAIDLSKVPAGTYTAEIRAVGTSALYTASDWSDTNTTITSTTSAVAIGKYEGAGETYAIEHPDTYVYWEQTDGMVSECTLEDGNVTIEFANATPTNWYDVQLFLHKENIAEGSSVKLTLDINASVAGKITLCGNVLDLEQGDNAIVVTYTAETVRKPSWAGATVHALEGATFDLIFGVDGQGAHNGGKFVLSNITFGDVGEATKLAAPSFTLAENVITITDTNAEGVAGYALGFFADEASVPAATLTVANGDTVNTASVPNGSYTVKLMAKAANLLFTDSDWSTSTAQLTVNNEYTAIEYSEEKSAFTGWKYWDSKAQADWNQWTAGVVEYAHLNTDGSVSLKFTIDGTGANWAVQLFYKHEQAAENYNVSFTVQAADDTTINVCGAPVELKANVPQTVTRAGYKSAQGSAIDIQCGLTSTTLTLSAISVTEPAPKQKLAAPTALEISENTFTVTPADGAAENTAKYEVGFFRDGRLVQNFLITTGTSFEYDYAAFLNKEEHAVKVRALAAEGSAEYLDSDWFDSGKTVTGGKDIPTVGGTAIEKVANYGAARDTSGVWNYFFEGVNNDLEVEYCTIEGEALGSGNTIKVKYTYTGNVWTAFNLLYKFAAAPTGNKQVSFDIVSSVDGAITVSAGGEQAFDVKAGESVRVTKQYGGDQIWLRFGKVPSFPLVGEFEIKNIQITDIVSQKLATPSFTYDSETGVITIVDEANAGKVKEYQLHFYQDGADVGNAVVENGATVEPAGLAVGEYTVKLVAVGDGIFFTSSDPSETSAAFTVETLNTSVPLNTGDIDTAKANHLKWIAWKDPGDFVDTYSAVRDTETDVITVSLTYKSDNRPWHSLRLVYGHDTPPKYMKITITVEKACTVCIAETDYQLEAGANELYISVTKTGAVTSIGFGGMSGGAVEQTYVLSDIEFTDVAPPATSE